MKRICLRLLPVLSLLLAACNFSIPAPLEPSLPTEVPSPAVTAFPLPGDLGFGNITGQVTDALTGQPVANATVTCEHFSYTSNEVDRCNRTTATSQEGVFLFEEVFFHDTDTIKLTVEASGYQTEKITQAFFTWNSWEVNISLQRVP